MACVIAADDGARFQAQPLHGLRFIGEAVEPRQRERAPQHPEAKHLRRLRAPETFARLRPHDARVVVDTFQCVRDRQCEEAADVVVRELALQSQRAVRVDARPRGIVHHNPVVIDTGHSR